jgi:DNA-binding LacI/PurR family transcriptional regulator
VVATLKDVARRAGVSVKTVSNVVHGYAYVTEGMRERVQKALEELNYQPNLPARYLRKGRMGVIALAIPYLNNPYFAEIGKAVIAAASAHAYTVLLDHTDGERTKEAQVLSGMHPRLIDGVILSPLALDAQDLQPRQVETPLVLLGERLMKIPYDHILIDNVAAARVATEHLIQMGRRRIAAIGIQNASTGETAHLRLRGYYEALEAAGLQPDQRLLIQSLAYNRADGVQAMRHLLTLDQPPDAVFCFNDLLALGASRAIFEVGLRIPEDVALVGFDDIEEARFATPSLTTLAPDKARIGELAVAHLVRRMNGTYSGPAEQVEAPFCLIPRESTLGCGMVDR